MYICEMLKSFGRPWQDLNLQSPVSETDALSIWPQGRSCHQTKLAFCQPPRFQHLAAGLQGSQGVEGDLQR